MSIRNNNKESIEIRWGTLLLIILCRCLPPFPTLRHRVKNETKELMFIALSNIIEGEGHECPNPGGGGEGALPYIGYIGMCRNEG